MINQFEVPLFVGEALPEIAPELRANLKPSSPYDAVGTLTQFTNKNIKEHNYKVVKRCFKVADKLYCRGNNAVKNAVENVFVYSFTNMFQANKTEQKRLLAIIPITLYSVYVAQLYRTGC